MREGKKKDAEEDERDRQVASDEVIRKALRRSSSNVCVDTGRRTDRQTTRRADRHKLARPWVFGSHHRGQRINHQSRRA